MPVLRVVRPRQCADLLHRYRLFVDGVCVGTVARGSKLELQLPPGRYELGFLGKCRKATPWRA
jgi:hypothetical protein